MPTPKNRLAYLDTFSGLIPCIVTHVEDGARFTMTVKLTASRGAYKRGEVLTEQSPTFIVPRTRLYRRSATRGGNRILPYAWREILGLGAPKRPLYCVVKSDLAVMPDNRQHTYFWVMVGDDPRDYAAVDYRKTTFARLDNGQRATFRTEAEAREFAATLGTILD